jgi:hypothetical protein
MTTHYHRLRKYLTTIPVCCKKCTRLATNILDLREMPVPSSAIKFLISSIENFGPVEGIIGAGGTRVCTPNSLGLSITEPFARPFGAVILLQNSASDFKQLIVQL